MKVSQKQKEERDTNTYLRRRLAWCNRTGQQFDEGEEQYSLFPRALADPDDNPHKGVKSKLIYIDMLLDQILFKPSNSTEFTPYLLPDGFLPYHHFKDIIDEVTTISSEM